MMQWWQIVLGLAVPAITAVGVVWGARVARKQTPAETASILIETALDMMEPLKNRESELEDKVQHLEDQVDRLERENELLHRWGQLLYTQVLEAGGEPYDFEHVRRLSGE